MAQTSLRRTAVSMGDVAPILRHAFLSKTGVPLGPAEPYLLAMMAMETDHGQSIYNNNWGNITLWQPRKFDSAHGPAQDYFKFDGNERDFVSFPSSEAGASHFVDTLLRPQHRRIVEAAFRNNFDDFFAGIATPHSRNDGRMYCDTCYSQAAKDHYRQLVVQYGGEEVPVSSTLSLDSGYRAPSLHNYNVEKLPRKPFPFKSKETVSSSRTRSSGGGLLALTFVSALVGGFYIYQKPNLRKKLFS